MTPGETVLLNTLEAILEELRENRTLAEARGVTLDEIAELYGISRKQLSRRPWLLPPSDGEYAKNIYSRRQLVVHHRRIEEHGIEQVRRDWMVRQRRTA